MHHMNAALHWSRLPEEHAVVIAPYIHPALQRRSFALYLLQAFFLHGRRVRYDGSPLVLPEEGQDAEWMGSAVDGDPALPPAE
jgi:hypothetical protein